MSLFGLVCVTALLATLILVGITCAGSRQIERRHPPVGHFRNVGGTRLHYVHVPGPRGTLPPLVFFHGATANLNDQMVPLQPLLEGRAELLFVDRPGHGWSARGRGNDTPFGQAKTIAALMDELGIDRAMLIGHSFGGATAAAFALAYPERTSGLVMLAPASHPWPGGATAWYYSLAAMPILGPLFVATLIYPLGLRRLAAATQAVFAPNEVPDDYAWRAAIPLILRPCVFRANALDVAGLFGFVSAAAPRYQEIAAPCVIITGDRDTVVADAIHAAGLAQALPQATLVRVRNLGHKPDWIARDLVLAGIENVAGLPRDLAAATAKVEARIADDRFPARPVRAEGQRGSAELAPQ